MNQAVRKFGTNAYLHRSLPDRGHLFPLDDETTILATP